MLNSILLLFGNFGAPELIIIVVIILLLFGGRKIPELMRGIGKGIRSYKEGLNDVKNEIEKPINEGVKEAEKKAEKKTEELKSNE